MVIHSDYSYLENRMDRGVWRATVHRVAKSRTPLMKLSTHAHVEINECTNCPKKPKFMSEDK